VCSCHNLSPPSRGRCSAGALIWKFEPGKHVGRQPGEPAAGDAKVTRAARGGRLEFLAGKARAARSGGGGQPAGRRRLFGPSAGGPATQRRIPAAAGLTNSLRAMGCPRRRGGRAQVAANGVGQQIPRNCPKPARPAMWQQNDLLRPCSSFIVVVFRGPTKADETNDQVAAFHLLSLLPPPSAVVGRRRPILKSALYLCVLPPPLAHTHTLRHATQTQPGRTS
jgi:hypothetical protein